MTHPRTFAAEKDPFACWHGSIMFCSIKQLIARDVKKLINQSLVKKQGIAGLIHVAVLSRGGALKLCTYRGQTF